MEFGGRQQDLTYLATVYLTFLKMGIDVNTFKRRHLIRNLWKFLFFACLHVYLEWAMIHYLVENLDEILENARVLTVSNQGILIVMKMVVFILKGDKYMKLIGDMNLLAKKEANAQEFKKFEEENRLALLISKMYFCLCYSCITVAGLLPLPIMMYLSISKGSYDRIYPFEAIFPLDGDSFIFLIFNYACSFFYLFSMAGLTVGIDSIYIWYIFNISAHFRILRSKVKSVALKLENGDDLTFNQDIGFIVRYHMKTLGFIDALNDVFGGILWFEVTLSCLQMCFAIYNLKYEEDISKLPFNVLVLLTLSMQLMMYCFGGQKIKNECLNLSVNIYLCFPWAKMSPKQKRLMLLPLMRAQTISALRGLFFEADCNLLVYIVKTGFSFNTLLNAMKE